MKTPKTFSMLTFVIQNKEDKNLLSAFLLELLDYQDVAQQVFLSALLEVDQAVLEHQTIGNFEKIKLLILTKGENAKIAEMAKKVLARIGHQLEYQQIIDLDYLRMVKEIPWDLHLVAGKIINEALTSLSGQQKTSFFTKLIENCKSAVTKKIQEIKDADELARQKEEPCLLNIGEIEETLGIFPVVLTALVTNFQVSQFEELFDAIIGPRVQPAPHTHRKAVRSRPELHQRIYGQRGIYFKNLRITHQRTRGHHHSFGVLGRGGQTPQDEICQI
jgi:hypothetical protein